MQSLAFFLSALVAASVTSAAPAPASPNVVSALYDGKCYYPTADPSFVAADYLGKWYVELFACFSLAYISTMSIN